MTRQEAAKLLVMIEGAYPGRFESTDHAIDAWATLLGDLPYEIAAQAVAALCRTNVHPPTVAEIRKAVFEVCTPLPEVEEAYEAARKAARRYSPYAWHPWQKVDSTADVHPLVKRALDVIGIETMAYTDDPEVVGAQFRRVYANLREREMLRRRQGDAAMLPGSTREVLMLMKGDGES